MKSWMTILAAFALLQACSTTGATGREVRRETVDQRKSPVIVSAKLGTQYFHLRQHNFFDYLEDGELYAGTYSQKGDSLLLGFHNNHQPVDLTGSGLWDRQGNVIVLFSKDVARHRRLAIVP